MTYGENWHVFDLKTMTTYWIFRTNNFRWSYPYNSNMALPLKIERGLEEQNSNSNKNIDFRTLYIIIPNMPWPNYHIKPISIENSAGKGHPKINFRWSYPYNSNLQTIKKPSAEFLIHNYKFHIFAILLTIKW